MTDLLSAPSKKSSDVDLVKPLKNIIASLYSTADTPVDFSAAINEFNKSRQQALSKTLDKSLPALEVLYKYHDQIAALESKIPAQDLNIPFKWKDAFDKGSLFGGKVSLTVSSLGYEKVCVLYNIAALQTQVGALGRISDTDEELKSAARLFQNASGIFVYLKSAASVMGGQEPTPDLNSETLTALSTLSLAQAQEIFVTKAIQDKMKDPILAKLCIQCEDMYADALRNMQKDSVKHLWDKEWIPNVAGKQAAFAALAQYFQSNVCALKKHVGEQIARLNVCIETLKQAQHRSGVPGLFSDYVSKATRLLTEAKKDNDFIYHERIPDSSCLATIDKVATARLAKPTPMSDRLASHFKDLFEDLVPVSIHQAMASCDVRKTELVNSRVGQLREASQLLNSILASLNLPAALEDSPGSDSVPLSLKEKARSVQDLGGIAKLQALISEMPELVQRNKEILDEADRLLRDEEDSDNQLRNQLQGKWTRTSSDKLNSTFKTNATRYREIINNALAADDVVKNKFNMHREAMMMLSGGEQALASGLPKNSTASTGTGSAGAKDNLKHLMNEVEEVKRHRDVLESKIKSMTFDLKAVFLSALAQDGAIDEPVVSTSLLGSAFNPLEQEVKESLQRQEQLVSAIQSNSDEFFGIKQGSDEGIMSKRDQIMRQLAEGYDAFVGLQSNTNEGRKFYGDLTQLLLAFQNKISDFCFARKTEKEELLKDVTRDAASVTSTSQAPPPRPPPPSIPAASAPNFASAPAPQPQQPMMGQQHPPPYQQQPQQGNLPYPTYPQNMPMPMPFQQQQPMPYQFTPMPGGYNPYAAYAPVPPQNYAYPVQPMGYPPNPNYYGQPQPQQPPPQQ